jgi:DNA-directed RNA polymerase delta subunit
MSQIKLDVKVVLNDQHWVQAPNGDVLYMMNVKTGKYLYLNEVATEIWRHIKTPITVQEICLKLEAAFDVDAAQCQNEVIGFLNKLKQEGNLEIC